MCMSPLHIISVIATFRYGSYGGGQASLIGYSQSSTQQGYGSSGGYNQSSEGNSASCGQGGYGSNYGQSQSGTSPTAPQ